MFYRAILLFLIFFSSCINPKKSQFSESSNNQRFSILEKSKNKKLKLSNRFHLIDSLFKRIQKSPLDSLDLAIIAYKSTLHYKLNEKDSSLFYDHYLLKKALQETNNYYSGKAYLNIALHYDGHQKIDSAFYFYNLSKRHFQKLKDSSQVGRRLMSMGLIQQHQNDYFGSKESITEALQYLNSKKDSKYTSSSYNALGTNHRKLLNFEEAIRYYSLAIKTTQSKKDKLIYQNNLAATYIDEKQCDKAISLLTNIEKDELSRNNQREYARVLDNLTYAKWLSGKNIREVVFQKPLNLRKQNNDQRGQIASYTHLGEFYSKTNIVKATSYFDSVIQLSKTIKIPRAEKDALTFLMKLKPKNISLRDRYIFLQDSLYNQELKVKTQFAKYKYDDKVIQEENLRLEKENAEQELKVAKQRNQKILSYTIGVPLFLILGFLTYFFVQRSKRLKKENKTAKLEANYETETELSRRLHDDFGGKLNHAMLLLQSDVNNEEVLNIVDELYNQSRDFSREINDVDTGPNFKNFLVGMMGNYCKNRKLMTTGSTEVDWLKLSPLSKKTVFKVLQELMINMQRHSNATLISIVFEQTNKILKVTYADDGVGATKEELDIKNGLWNTEKRIKAIGGTIIFDSEKGQGFEARIQIPN